MPLQLDDYDVSIISSLLKDGRKSFREVSRETGITTPTVKARFTRLVNVGFIKSVSPILDFNIVEEEKQVFKRQNKRVENVKIIENEDYKNKRYHSQQHNTTFKIKKGLKIRLDCEFCKGPISANLHVYKFANYERFFCCTGCMTGYKRKYAGRIESIKRKFEGKDE